jgi:hypothetical protein
MEARVLCYKSVTSLLRISVFCFLDILHQYILINILEHIISEQGGPLSARAFAGFYPGNDEKVQKSTE